MKNGVSKNHRVIQLVIVKYRLSKNSRISDFEIKENKCHTASDFEV